MDYTDKTVIEDIEFAYELLLRGDQEWMVKACGNKEFDYGRRIMEAVLAKYIKEHK